MSAAAHEEEWRSSPPQAQQPPRNTFESIAERSRHLDERRQAGSATPVQPAVRPDGTGRRTHAWQQRTCAWDRPGA